MRVFDRTWELTPLLGGLSVILVASCFRHFVLRGLSQQPMGAPFPPNPQWESVVAAQIVWATCATILACGSVAVLLVCVHVIMGNRLHRDGFWPIALALALLAAVVAWTNDQSYVPEVQTYRAFVTRSPLNCLVKLGVVAVVLLMSLLMMTNAAVLWKTSEPYGKEMSAISDEQANNLSASLALRMQNARHTLYAGAFLLSGAALSIRALFDWAAIETGVPIDQIGRALTFSFASFFTMFLAGTYLPTALLLYHRAALLVRSRKNVDVSDRRQWLDDRELGSSPIVQLLAIIAPIATSGPGILGVLGDLGKKVAEAG